MHQIINGRLLKSLNNFINYLFVAGICLKFISRQVPCRAAPYLLKYKKNSKKKYVNYSQSLNLKIQLISISIMIK